MIRVIFTTPWLPLWIPLLFALCSCGDFMESFPPPELPQAKMRPHIFDRYRPNWDSDMADGWTRGMDMSGVSFNRHQTATLVTPRHVVMAKHFARGVASDVILHDRNGKRVRREIAALASGRGDVMVGLLNKPVPDGFTSRPRPALFSLRKNRLAAASLGSLAASGTLFITVFGPLF